MGDTFDDAEASGAQASAREVDYLAVVLECDRPLAGAARYGLSGVQRVTLGRGDRRSGARYTEHGLTTLDVRVPGRSMSSAHARLIPVGGGWAIEDAASKNGTFVNSARVERAVLAPGDVVELGHTLFRVLRSASPRAGTPGDLDVAFPGGDAWDTLDPVLASRLETLAKLAPSPVALLLLGESGVGKEVLARWLHARTGRKGDFIAVNCGAIPSTLVESQLFGHLKGAFSGALRDEPGFVRAADGGTLFLDEIADLPKGSQAALLRVIQEREIVPVGATRPVPVDVRLFSATHAALDDLVLRGDFRRDLLARIAGARVTLPALRDRPFDLGVLVATLLRRLASGRQPELTLSSDAGRALLLHDWPLNVRELEQCLQTCVALAGEGGVIRPEHLPPTVAAALAASASKPPGDDAHDRLSDRDRQTRLELLAKLAEHRGNLTEVARAMGKGRTQVQRWCARFGIDAKAYRG